MEAKAQEAHGTLGTELESEASPTDTAHEAPGSRADVPGSALSEDRQRDRGGRAGRRGRTGPRGGPDPRLNRHLTPKPRSNHQDRLRRPARRGAQSPWKREGRCASNNAPRLSQKVGREARRQSQQGVPTREPSPAAPSGSELSGEMRVIPTGAPRAPGSKPKSAGPGSQCHGHQVLCGACLTAWTC